MLDKGNHRVVNIIETLLCGVCQEFIQIAAEASQDILYIPEFSRGGMEPVNASLTEYKVRPGILYSTI